MIFSSFGQKLTGNSGILQLMDDIARPLPEGVKPCMLGGGNPARLSGIEKTYRKAMESLLARGDAFEQAIGHYDSPQGRISFIEAVATFLHREYGWNIDAENVAITNGSQSAFFYLFNLFSGNMPTRRTILFPLVPEYVGYADQGIDPDTFVTLPATIELEGEHSFKYHIDIPLVTAYLDAHPEVGAICVSRPTNPTGNVLTGDEITRLAALAARHNIPLMVDNAYGLPFPNIVFPDMIGEAPTPYWDEHTILSMSLSKIGLPALRTGIVVADKQIITALGALNSIAALTTGSIGQILAEDLIRSGEIKKLADTVAQPFYRKKSEAARQYIAEFWGEREYRVHRSEGAIFLWLYLPNLGISGKDLYRRLKERGVVVVPGEYFFFGRESGSEEETAWKRHPHREKCLRLNYSADDDEVREGLKIIAEVSSKYCS